MTLTCRLKNILLFNLGKVTCRRYEKTSCVKSQIVQGNEKTVPNGKFELKVYFGSVIIYNTCKIIICYFLLTYTNKSNTIFMNFWHIGDFTGLNNLSLKFLISAEIKFFSYEMSSITKISFVFFFPS